VHINDTTLKWVEQFVPDQIGPKCIPTPRSTSPRNPNHLDQEPGKPTTTASALIAANQGQRPNHPKQDHLASRANHRG
jgi:hypothetical protein